MSTLNQPEEIEEGEIAPLPESEYETESNSDSDENDEIENMEGDDEMMFEDEGLDIAELMTSLLATEDGDTVCTALVGITQQLQMQNKILIKILSELKSN
mgnify:CR=1 FL=1